MATFKCPDCDSPKTFPVPETGYERFCGDCNAVYEDPQPPSDY